MTTTKENLNDHAIVLLRMIVIRQGRISASPIYCGYNTMAAVAFFI